MLRVEAGSSGISPSDLRPWGLAGNIAWSILTYSETHCRDKEARLELLKAVAEDIVAKCEAAAK